MRFSLVLGASALCAIFQACSRSPQANSIALITPLTTSELWKTVHAGVVAATSEAHMSWYWNAPTHQDDADRQMDLVDRQISLGAAGIVLVPAHGSALIPVIRQAQTSHVPLVIAVDSLAVPLGVDIGSVTSDERAAGILAAGLVSKVSQANGSVAIVGINAASTRTVERVSAFETEVRRSGKVRVALKLDDTVGPGGKSEGELLRALHREPKMLTVFAPSLSGTRAAYAILQQEGLLHRIQLVGCDQDEDLYAPIRRGEIAGVIAQNAFQIGYQSTQMLVRYKRNRETMQHITIEPLLLDRANLDSETTRRFLHPYSGFDR